MVDMIFFRVVFWISVIISVYLTNRVAGVDPRALVPSNKSELAREITPNKEISLDIEGEIIDVGLTHPGLSGISNSTHNYVLPYQWRSFCTVRGDEVYQSEFTPETRLVSIQCEVTREHSGVWTMLDLRESLDIYKDSNLSFSVNIQCDSATNISLSWPFKVNNLFRMQVKNCVILDFLKEHNHTALETTPDSIRVLQIKDCVILESISRFLQMAKTIKYISKEFDCVQEDTIESLSIRNITYEFLEGMDYIVTKLTELGEQFILDTSRIAHKCDYKHMMTLDEGHSTSMSLYHMDLVTESGLYFELRTYNMSYNYIKVLKDQQLQWSKKFPKLEMFDLSHNNISKLYSFAIPLHNRMDKVVTINLQYNQISTLTVSDLERFKDFPMMFIDLRNNPMDCNCSNPLTELIAYVRDGKHVRISNLSDYTYIGELQCQGPDPVAGKTLKSLTSDMVCEPVVQTEYFLVPILILSAVVIILSILLFMVVRFRQEITIILFTRFNIIVPCQTRENYDSQKKYDAFVSYSSSEDDFVEKLFEDLEAQADDKSRPSFKFCMHHRDFIPGKTIFDNVTHSVESSRHTIILLSNHFIKSEFCLYEFQEAFRQSIMEKRRHLVIVMLEDIPEADLPRDLRRCIKTFTYIRKDDFLFTERLIYALSVKHKGKTVQKLPKSSRDGNIDSISYKTVKSSQPPKDNPPKQSSNVKNKTSTDIICDYPCSENTAENTSQTNSSEKQKRYRKNSKGGKLDLTIKYTSDSNLSPVERKINNKELELEYERSLSLVSQDTGYGSEKSFTGGNQSPDASINMDDFTQQAVIC